MTNRTRIGADGPRAMLETMVPLLQAGDLAGVAELYADDGVHELPFAPPGVPARIEGREHIRAYFTQPPSGAPLTFHEFDPVAVHDTIDPGVIIAEYDAHGEVSGSRRTFTVRYVWVLRVVDGEIVFWRDYWSPADIVDLQGIQERR